MANAIYGPGIRYGAAVAVSAVALGTQAVSPCVTDGSPLAPFFGSVLLAAWIGGFGPAMLAMVLGLAFTADRFLASTEPRFPQIVSVALYLLVGVVVSVLGERLRQARQRAAHRDDELARTQQQLHERNEELTDLRQQSHFLAEVGESLASPIDYEATLEAVSNLAIPFLADWCALDVRQRDGSWRRLCAGPSERPDVQASQDLDRAFALTSGGSHGPGHVAQTRQEEHLETISDAMLVHWATDPEHLARLRLLHPATSLCLPLKLHGDFLGVLTLLRLEEQHPFTQGDLAVAEEVGCRAAMAIENALLRKAADHSNLRKQAASDARA